jgi:hypothetical protein
LLSDAPPIVILLGLATDLTGRCDRARQAEDNEADDEQQDDDEADDERFCHDH